MKTQLQKNWKYVLVKALWESRRQEHKISSFINKTNTVENRQVGTQAEGENLSGINSLREEMKYKLLKQNLFADMIINQVKHFISTENLNKKLGINIPTFFGPFFPGTDQRSERKNAWEIWKKGRHNSFLDFWMIKCRSSKHILCRTVTMDTWKCKQNLQ